MMVVGLGGRGAEEIAIGEISSGASNDLRQVTIHRPPVVAQLGNERCLRLAQFRAMRIISRFSATR